MIGKCEVLTAKNEKISNKGKSQTMFDKILARKAMKNINMTRDCFNHFDARITVENAHRSDVT